MNDLYGDVHCEIRSRPTPDGVEVAGIVWSESLVAGSYTFIVNKEGPSGISHVAQSGLFALQDREPHVVGMTTVKTGNGDRYAVRLVISDDDHTLCTASLG